MRYTNALQMLMLAKESQRVVLVEFPNNSVQGRVIEVCPVGEPDIALTLESRPLSGFRASSADEPLRIIFDASYVVSIQRWEKARSRLSRTVTSQD